MDPLARLNGSLCLITGATGFVGSWLCDALIERGARVRCLVRQRSRRVIQPTERLELASGDITDYDALRSAVAGVDYVFHVAGLINAPAETDYFRVNYLGTINLLEAIRSSRGEPRVVVVSSQAAVGPSTPGRATDEGDRCRPLTPYGRSKLRGEQAALAYRAALPLTIVRPPTAYGPRDRETLAFFRLAAAGIRPVLADGAISVVHVSDLVDGILLAGVADPAIGQTYFISGEETPSLDELVAALGTAVGQKGRPVRIAPWMVRSAGRAAEVVRGLTGHTQAFDRWKAEEILAGYWACSNARAKAELGFVPRISLMDGLRATAEWYRAQGWL